MAKKKKAASVSVELSGVTVVDGPPGAVVIPSDLRPAERERKVEALLGKGYTEVEKVKQLQATQPLHAVFLAPVVS